MNKKMPAQIDEFWRIKVNSDAWNKVLHLGVRQEFKQGETIVHAGEKVTELRYIESGTVCLKRTSMEGNEKIIMCVDKNSLFSEVAFFTGEEMHSTFCCQKDAVIYAFSKDTVDDMLDRHPYIAKDILRTLSLKVSVLSNQLASLGLDRMEQRVAKFILLRYSSEPLASKIISLGCLKMKDIASILGVHRASLYKTLKTMEKAGLIELLGENRMLIHDIEGLTELAQH
ncbi:Crp/Fnr family transcriptional regulator [Maridesulfovibrio sp.]|uniref:Crp/Fnr family transcriptional regulator n=1 Tax=Maridesulfovibrio sp. TaxID=2795000 RepID=UPI0039EE7F0C